MPNSNYSRIPGAGIQIYGRVLARTLTADSLTDSTHVWLTYNLPVADQIQAKRLANMVPQHILGKKAWQAELNKQLECLEAKQILNCSQRSAVEKAATQSFTLWQVQGQGCLRMVLLLLVTQLQFVICDGHDMDAS